VLNRRGCPTPSPIPGYHDLHGIANERSDCRQRTAARPRGRCDGESLLRHAIVDA